MTYGRSWAPRCSRGDGAGWQVALTADDVGGQILDVWSPGPDEVWVLGSDNLVHRRVGGGDWTTMNPLGGDATAQLRRHLGDGPEGRLGRARAEQRPALGR